MGLENCIPPPFPSPEVCENRFSEVSRGELCREDCLENCGAVVDTIGREDWVENCCAVEGTVECTYGAATSEAAQPAEPSAPEAIAAGTASSAVGGHLAAKAEPAGRAFASELPKPTGPLG